MSARQIFVPLIGQYENIGDIVLRRKLVEWVAPLGEVHVYVGKSPHGYDDALGLPAGSKIYRSVLPWVYAALRASFSRRARVIYLYKPGEIQLSVTGLKEHLGLVPIVAFVRLFGGFVGRLGAGSREFQRIPRSLVRLTLGLSHLTLWRDGKTAQMLGGSGVMPDFGFGIPSQYKGRQGIRRDRLTVTMRGDRARPSDNWIQGISEAARQLGLRLTVVTQVVRDEAAGFEISDALGKCELVSWDGYSHGEQEDRVREIYRSSELVVSDRLHALIMAVSEGSGVICVSDSPTDKIRRHFEAAGIPVETLDSARTSPKRLAERISAASRAGESQLAKYDNTVALLEDARTRFYGLVGELQVSEEAH